MNTIKIKTLLLTLLCLVSLVPVCASPPDLDLNLFTPFSTEAEVGIADLFVAPDSTKDKRLVVYYWGNTKTCGTCRVFERDRVQLDEHLRIEDGWKQKLPNPTPVGLPTFRFPLPDGKTWRVDGYDGPDQLLALVRAKHRDAVADKVKGWKATASK